MKKNPKPAKEKAKEPVLLEQVRIDAHIKEELQESTSEQGFSQSEETLVADEIANTEDSNSGWIYKPSDEEVLKNGTLVDGKYEIVSLLGHGGMGSVYIARHKELGTKIALKVLHRFLVNTPSAVKRFKSEARAAHSLSSKNLVSVLDYGILEDGQPYLTMHYIDGTNLFDYLKTHGPLSIGATFSVVKQVATALEEAHSKGIVHRDIKPSNILIEGNSIKDGSVKVVDFGISKGMWGGENTQQVTHTGQIFGSPFYMSPEQCKGESVDYRTDLYSLGCVMFECLTGSRLFEGKNAIETLMMHCHETPPTLGVEGKPPGGFSEAKTILQKLLEKDPQKRHQNARALIDALKGEPKDSTDSKESLFPQKDRQWKGKAGARSVLITALAFLALTLVPVALFSQQNGDESAKSNAREHLQELLDMGLTYRNQIPETNPQRGLDYMHKAIAFAEKTFGKNSLEAARAYNLTGKHYRHRFFNGANPPEPAINNFRQALKIVNSISETKVKPIPDVAFVQIRQNYMLDLAGATYDQREAESLYSMALSLGPMPLEVDTYSELGHWHDYKVFLMQRGKTLEVAHAYVEMNLQRRVSTPAVTELSKQDAQQMMGEYSGGKEDSWKTDTHIRIIGEGEKLTAKYTGGYWDYSKNMHEDVKHLDLKGNFEKGVFKIAAPVGEFFIPYSAIKVGKYLVVLDNEAFVQDSKGRYIPHPFSDLFLNRK